MGTHDETNKAEPQNEFISGFKIKGSAISGGSEGQKSYVTRSPKIGEGIPSQKSASGLQNRMGTNPYQLTPQMNKTRGMQQPGNDPFEKETGPGFIQKIKSRLFKEDSSSGSIRQKAMVLLIPVLFIVMIFMFRQVLWKAPKKTKAANGKSKSVALVNKSSSDEIDWTIPEPLPTDMRDPIKFGTSSSKDTVKQTSAGNESTGMMDVKSILYSEDKPSVVIGNRLVYINQKVNGATVVEIHKDYIVFERDGKQWSQKVINDVINLNQTGKVSESNKTVN